MVVVTRTEDKKNKWRIVGKGTRAVHMGVPGDFFRLSGNGKIAAVGSERVVAFYGINYDGKSKIPSSSTNPTTTTTKNGTSFSICDPFSDAKINAHVGDLDQLPKQEVQHTLSVAMSKDGSVVAVGIDETPDENLGMVRVFAWSCDDQQCK